MPRANTSFVRMMSFLVARLSRRFDLDSMGCAPSECTKYSVDVKKYLGYRTIRSGSFDTPLGASGRGLRVRTYPRTHSPRWPGPKKWVLLLKIKYLAYLVTARPVGPVRELRHFSSESKFYLRFAGLLAERMRRLLSLIHAGPQDCESGALPQDAETWRIAKGFH